MADADGGPGPSAAAGTTPAYRGARETVSAHRQALAADKSPERLAAEAEAADAERAQQQQQQQQEKQQQPTRQDDAAGDDGFLSATDSDDDDNNQGQGWAARPLSSSSGGAGSSADSGEAAAAAATAVPRTGLFGEVREGELEQLMWQRQALSAELASLEVDVQVERVSSRGGSGGRGPLRWGQPGQPPPPHRADCALELEQGVQLIGVSSARPDGLLTVVHASSAPEGEEEGSGGGADGGGSPMRPRVARLERGCGARGEEAGGLTGWRRRMEGAEARRQELLRRRGATGRHHTATAAARRQQREQLATRRPHSAPQRRNGAPRMQRCRLPSPLQTPPPPTPTKNTQQLPLWKCWVPAVPWNHHPA
jgi:hypothetical protein